LIETGEVDGYAVLAVDDNGKGMSREFVERRLFRPLQTTKASGLGIGLYQCRHIIQSYGGTLAAESEEGKGTRMTVKLPIAEGPQSAQEGIGGQRAV
jgi:signal transduction histidine kinase